MIPGKAYKIEDFVEMAWRRRWLLVLPFVIATVGGFTYSQFLPDRYESEAVILIVPQRVPNNLVQTTVSSTLASRLNSISAQILSRTRLERVVNEFDLYRDERETELMEDVIEGMRRDINVGIPRRRQRNMESFTVSFETDNRQTAMQVTQRLASLFIQENLESRELQADATTRFLESQLEEARRGLVEHEQRLATYRRQHSGSLPSQLGSNLSVLQSTQSQLRSLNESANRLLDRRLIVERLIAEASSRVSLEGAEPTSLDDLPADAPAALQLEMAKVQLRNLELRLQPQHPDVVQMRSLIADLEVKAEEEALAQPLVAAGDVPLTRSPLEEQIASYQFELTNIERQLEANRVEQAQLEGSLGQLRNRIDATPTRESELAELMRDYNTLQSGYTALLQKSEQARLALNLERRQIGEQFRMIDAPRLPQRPVSPDRQQMTLMSGLIGLAFGAALGLLLEYRDTTMRSMDDVVMSVSLPVLAVVPLMTSTRERKQQRLVRWVAASIAGVAVLGGVAAAWRLGWIDRIIDPFI